MLVPGRGGLTPPEGRRGGGGVLSSRTLRVVSPPCGG